jgi:hypothetical protein
MILTVAACGIKPNRLDPPEGSPNKTFPNPYPKENTP